MPILSKSLPSHKSRCCKYIAREFSKKLKTFALLTWRCASISAYRISIGWKKRYLDTPNLVDAVCDRLLADNGQEERRLIIRPNQPRLWKASSMIPTGTLSLSTETRSDFSFQRQVTSPHRSVGRGWLRKASKAARSAPTVVEPPCPGSRMVSSGQVKTVRASESSERDRSCGLAV